MPLRTPVHGCANSCVAASTLGLEPIGNTPAEFAAAIEFEMSRWAKVIKEARISPNP